MYINLLFNFFLHTKRGFLCAVGHGITLHMTFGRIAVVLFPWYDKSIFA